MYNVGTPFFREIKRRAEAKVSQYEWHHDWRYNFKVAVILLVNLLGFYYGWIHNSLLWIFVFAVFFAQIPISLMHDSTHSSIHNKTVNELVGYVFNLIGSNNLTFRRSHVFGHHVYTNHDEYDHGIPIVIPFVRMHDQYVRKWWHKFQYVWISSFDIGFMAYFWLCDKGAWVTLYNYPMRKCGFTTNQLIETIAGKIFWFGWYFVLKFYCAPDWQTALLHQVILVNVSGSFVGFFIAVNHWNEDAALINDKDCYQEESDWAKMQVITSNNFAVDSLFWFNLTGGLNTQIEHHLFPNLISTRLYGMKSIVRDVCTEYGLDYDSRCYPSFWAALISYLKFMKYMGDGSKDKILKSKTLEDKLTEKKRK